MGKKAKLKELRKLAESLPALQRSAVEKEHFLGSVLIGQGIIEIDGKRVDPNKLYTKSTTVKVPVNHKRAMKKQFLKHGPKGVVAYGQAVENFVEEHKANAANEASQTNEG